MKHTASAIGRVMETKCVMGQFGSRYASGPQRLLVAVEEGPRLFLESPSGGFRAERF